MADSGATQQEVKQIVELMDENKPEAAAAALAQIGARDEEFLRREVSTAVRQAADRLMEPYNKRLQWLVLMICTLAGWTAPLTYGFAYWVYSGTLPHISMGAAMGMMVVCTAIGGTFGWWAGK